jgi:Domain of unknown function (DUF4279)
MTKSPKGAEQRAFATLRFSGDRLDPDQITAILGVPPTKAWRKEERYYAGEHTGYLLGRTGTWFLATNDRITSPVLTQHLEFLTSLFSRRRQDEPEPMAQLQKLMARDEVKADVSCFWHGAAGEQPPLITPQVTEKLRALPAEIETDFDTDEAPLAHSCSAR